MAIKLYGSSVSTRTQRVLLVLRELGLTYDFKEISMPNGEHKDPTYIRDFHPFGRLPALEDDDGTRLFESRAICAYLVAKYGEGSGLQKKLSPVELGKYDQAASVEYSYFDPAVSSLAYENIFKKLVNDDEDPPLSLAYSLSRVIIHRIMGRGDPDPAEVKHHKELLTIALDHYEAVLATSQYLASPDFSLVDIYHMPWMAFFSKLGMDDEISSRPRFRAWWERVSSRPSWQELAK